MWKLIVIPCLIYAAVALLLYLFQSSLVYFPTRVLAATPAAVDLAFEDVSFTTADGVTLHGWFVPAPSPRATLLFFHGNAGNISHRLESLLIFHRLGISVFIVDYRGYGRSGGEPTEQGTYQDAVASWRYLTEDRGISAGDIIVFGRSLGGAVAAWLAAQVHPAALIVESSFTSVPDLAAKIYPFLPVRFLSRFEYDTRSAVARAPCPVLVVHSLDDEIVPFDHGNLIFEGAREPKALLTIRGGHNDGFLLSGEVYLEGLRAFLGRALPSHFPGLPGGADATRSPNRRSQGPLYLDWDRERKSRSSIVFPDPSGGGMLP